MITGWHWTPEEVQLLTENPDLTDSVLADKLGRSVRSVQDKRSTLGLVKNRFWSDAEIQMVRSNPELSLHELSALIGRSVSSCHRYRQLLNREEVMSSDGDLTGVSIRKLDASYHATLVSIAMGLARGDEDVAAVILGEITAPGMNGIKVGTTVGEICQQMKSP